MLNICYSETVQKSQSRGFSLIEVMTAIFLIAVGLFALIALQLFSLRNQRGSTQRHTASVLAADIMDTAVFTLEEDFTTDVSQARTAAPIDGFEYSLTSEDASESDLLKVLKVVVFWDSSGVEHKFELETKVLQVD